MRRRSMASVSSLVQPCGANASIPGIEPRAAARRTTRTAPRGSASSGAGTARRRRGCSGGRTRPGDRAAATSPYGSVMFRFMSHLMYEIGALSRTWPRTRSRWSTTSARPRSRTSCWRLSVRGRPGMPIAQSGWAANSSLSALTISGSIQSPKSSPSAVIRLATPSSPSGSFAPVDEPVAERGRVVVAGAEPAVVEDEQLDAELARRRRRSRPAGRRRSRSRSPPSC